MYCPNCNKEYDGKFCQDCGTELIEKPSAGGFNLNFGDANAISGGVNLCDSHNVHNEDKSVHNITNNSSVVNNITTVERQKTASEELQEKKMQFNLLLDNILDDGVISEEEKLEIKNYQHQIGLDNATAQVLIDNARRRVHSNTSSDKTGGTDSSTELGISDTSDDSDDATEEDSEDNYAPIENSKKEVEEAMEKAQRDAEESMRKALGQ